MDIEERDGSMTSFINHDPKRIDETDHKIYRLMHAATPREKVENSVNITMPTSPTIGTYVLQSVDGTVIWIST